MNGEDSGFVFFFCWAEDFADLEDAVRLELFDAIVDYAKTGETKPLSRDAGLVFRAIRRGIDAYEVKRARISEARRNAGRKGGMRSPLESKPKQTEANESDQKQTEANEALKEKEKEKEKVKENSNGEKSVLTHTKKDLQKIEVAPSVLLTEAERDKFTADYGDDGAKELFAILSDYKLATGRRYKNDAAAIRNWVVDKWRSRRDTPMKRDVMRSIEEERRDPNRAEVLRKMGFNIL